MRKQTKLVAVLSATALLAIGASMTSFAAQGWTEEGGTWVYYNKDGSMATDQWKKSGNNWYWLDSDGTMATDQIVEDDSDYYYVDANGVMVTNQWVQVENEDSGDDDSPSNWWYYFTGNGKAYTANANNTTTLRTINGKKYAFTEEGKMLYGWIDETSSRQTDDEGWKDALYYMGDEDDGSAAIGWAQIHVTDTSHAWDDDADDEQDYWFYFQSNGKKYKAKDNDSVLTKTINGKKYGFDGDGRMIFEWNEDVVSTGSTATSSTTKVGYFNDRDNGARVSKGWFKVVPSKEVNKADNDNDDERWYYAYSVGKLCASEFKSINGKRYAFDNSGRMLDGLQVIWIDKDNAGANGDDVIMYNKKLDEEDLVKAASEDPKAITFSYVDSEGYTTDSGIEFADKLTIPSGDTSIPAGIYYFGGSDDGAAKTGVQTVNVDGENYTYNFRKDGDKKGMGYNGEKDKYLYQNGKRVKADKDNKYEAYVIAGSDANGTISAADAISGQVCKIDIDLIVGNNITDSKTKVNRVKTDYAANRVYLVGTSGSFVTNSTNGTKDGEDGKYYVKGGAVEYYQTYDQWNNKNN